MAAYWVGEYQESMNCCERLLKEQKLPADQHPRVRDNLESARRKLGLENAVVT